jgi:hypothetical protein
VEACFALVEAPEDRPARVVGHGYSACCQWAMAEPQHSGNRGVLRHQCTTAGSPWVTVVKLAAQVAALLMAAVAGEP